MHSSKASTRERIKRLNEQQAKDGASVPQATAPEKGPSAMPLPEAAPSSTASPADASPAIAPVVTYRCGHTSKVSQFKEEPCPECRAKNRQEKYQANLAKAAQRQAELNQGRLPHGSAFATDYDAEKVLWSGRLTVPIEGGVKVFEDSAGAVVSLLFRLDKQYRSFEAARTK